MNNLEIPKDMDDAMVDPSWQKSKAMSPLQQQELQFLLQQLDEKEAALERVRDQDGVEGEDQGVVVCVRVCGCADGQGRIRLWGR